MSTPVNNISPVIDLRSSSVKIISTQIDKASGNEKRFGRRYKLLSFYPVYKFNVTNLPTDSNGDPILPTVDQSVVGDTSNCRGEIIKVVGSLIYVKIKNSSLFLAGETLEFGVQSFSGVAVSPDGVTRVLSNFTPGTQVQVYQENLSDRFSNKIYGTIINWDEKTEQLTLLEEKAPINSDYYSYASGSVFARNSSNEGANQVSDVIRVGDNLWHQNISPEDATDTNESVPGFVEVSAVDYSDGILYTSDINSKNSTALSKYVTKEVTLANPATTVEVRLTANMAEANDVEVYYKVKPVNSQTVFDDIEWTAFNGNGLPDIEVVPTNESAIAGLFESQASYKEHKYSVSNLNEFASFAVKIVMKASNPCYIPKIQDARIVAAY